MKHFVQAKRGKCFHKPAKSGKRTDCSRAKDFGAQIGKLKGLVLQRGAGNREMFEKLRKFTKTHSERSLIIIKFNFKLSISLDGVHDSDTGAPPSAWCLWHTDERFIQIFFLLFAFRAVLKNEPARNRVKIGR